MDGDAKKNDRERIDECSISQTGLARKISVVAVLSFVLDTTFRLVGFMVFLVMSKAGWIESADDTCVRCIELGMEFPALVILGLFLMRWKKSMDRGDTLWFHTLRPARFILVIASCIVVPLFLEYLLATVFSTQVKAVLPKLGIFLGALHMQPRHMTKILQCMVWLWWCDDKPMDVSSLAFGSYAWVAYAGTLSVIFWPLTAALNYPVHSDVTFDVIQMIQKGFTIRHSSFQYLFAAPFGAYAFVVYLLQAAVQKYSSGRLQLE